MHGWKLCHSLCGAALLTAALASAGIAAEPATAPTGAARGYGAMPESAPSEPTSGATGTSGRVEEEKPEALEPLFVRPLLKPEQGRNDSNPVWSPKGTFLAFERSRGDKRELHITLPDGTPVQTVLFLPSDSGSEMKFFFPGVSEETSYNAGLTWSPDEYRFVFMSNGGEGNYDIYLQDLGAALPDRLTEHKEKDGQAHWSPAADRVVFVSGRTGSGDVYLLDLKTRALTRLTQGAKACLYPRWSPDGGKIVMMHGSNENHDIILLRDAARPGESRKALTTWAYDDLRPVWSPDGRKIAFYSNYNTAGDPKRWSLFVVAADGSDPTEGDGLAAHVAATDVLPDVEAGPAWLPDSNRIVFVKNDRREYNPLYVANIAQKTVLPIKTDTKMNHDAACSAEGVIAFRAQVDQWDQIFVAKLRN